MPNNKQRSYTLKRYRPHLVVGAGLLFLVAVFLSLKTAHAGPITGGPGNPPFTKLAVYQGIVSVVPGGLTDNLLEIGNGGRDIAGTGSIFIRPDSLNNGSANYAEFYKDVTNKASLKIPGTLCLGGVCNSSWPSGGGGTQHWTDDGATADTASYATIGVTRSAVAANNSYIGLTRAGIFAWGIGVGSSSNLIFGQASASPAKTIPTPFLSIGNTGGVTVPTGNLTITTGSETIAQGNLNVTAGNVLLTNGRLGVGNTTPTARLVVNNNLAGNGSAGDGGTFYVNSTNAAVYAEQSNRLGYAGYFSRASGTWGAQEPAALFAQNNTGASSTSNAAHLDGGLLVQQHGQSYPTFDQMDLVKIVSNSDPSALTGYSLSVANVYGAAAAGSEQALQQRYNVGMAAGFYGHVDIVGAGGHFCASCQTNRASALTVLNTAPDNINTSGIAVLGYASPAKTGSILASGGSFTVGLNDLRNVEFTGSIGVLGRASDAAGGKSSAGIVGISGTGTASYAGYFRGRVEIDGPIKATDGSIFEGVTSFEGVAQYKRFGSPTYGYLVANVAAQSGVTCQTACGTAGLGCWMGKNTSTQSIINCTDAGAFTKACLCS